ncbi:thermonuclease family protein [Pseudahrensia aquimaris]|uniref:Thermonuclease family protein n=1 Tax=Pseudahrensia aquimaris TaxID=744461 RepID=A0ABW3FF31_9HYPH
MGTVIWLNERNAQQFSGFVRVIDGDSLVVDGREIRLQGIDAPEYQQTCIRGGRDWRCGIASRDALRKLVRSGDVVCDASSVDQYDRWLGTCRVGEVNVNRAMVEQGWAVDFGDYPSAEREAEQQKLGIWQSEFDRPNVWRELNRGALSQ